MSHSRSQQAVDRPDACALTGSPPHRSARLATCEYQRGAILALESEPTIRTREWHRTTDAATVHAVGAPPATRRGAVRWQAA